MSILNKGAGLRFSEIRYPGLCLAGGRHILFSQKGRLLAFSCGSRDAVVSRGIGTGGRSFLPEVFVVSGNLADLVSRWLPREKERNTT